MDDIRHHLTDQLLLGYAMGNLPEAFDTVVATHISLCDECRARMHAFDAVGGVLLDEGDDAGIEEPALDESLAATLSLISGGTVHQKDAPRPKGGVFPAPLQEMIGGDLDQVRWRRIGGGVRQAFIKTKGEGTLRLLRIPGGVAVPDHGHRGTELTLVLQGAFKDEDGRFGRGDVEVANEEVEHQPVAEEGPDCICLAATDAPLRFNAMIPRLAQGILRI